MFNLDPILKKRVHAFTFDLFLILGMNYFLMASFTDFLKVMFFHFPIHTQLMLIHKFKYIHSLSLISIMFAYFSIFYYASNGQTMGKMITGLRVKAKNEEMSLKESLTRAFSYVVCAWFGSVLFITSFVRKDQKSVADLFSGTSVIVDEVKASVPQTEFQLTLMDFENHKPLTPIEVETENSEQDKAA
jgi:uncharacterized RDD family membrane protein YckC